MLMIRKLLSQPLSTAFLILAVVTISCTTPSSVQETPQESAPAKTSDAVERSYPVVEPQPFDNGKMWTFEHAPSSYFMEEYGLDLTDDWKRKAKRGTVRLPNCSGSFVSPRGLILTNHHCTRDEVLAVTLEGENLTDDGFYASTLSDERKIEGFYVDQLIGIEDVTYAIQTALNDMDDEDRTSSVIEAAKELEKERIQNNLRDDNIVVEVIGLYNGALYSAYTWHRYDDVRLVMVPELEIGYFGGDPDNFTYPRYTLDMALLRAYDDLGRPLEPEYYFNWSERGAREGDAVFVVGNPGSTDRLLTIAQLEYERDVAHPAFLSLLDNVATDFLTFMEIDPDQAAGLELRNYVFQLQNAVKAYTGALETLEDDYFMGRRNQAELRFRETITGDEALSGQFGDTHEKIEALVEEKRSFKSAYQALLGLNPGTILSSGTLQRAVLLGQIKAAQERGNRQAASFYESLIQRTIEWPEELELEMIKTRMKRIQATGEVAAGDEHQPVRFSDVSGGLDPEAFAEEIMSASGLTSIEATLAMLENGVDENDPGVAFGLAYGPHFEQLNGRMAGFEEQEERLKRQIGLARFEIHGTSVPPDATFSLRLQDGRVASYDYNGTRAPAFTTFYGLFNRHHAHGREEPWTIPANWYTLPRSFDLSTRLNLVSTNDIIGGNSGSPLLSIDLELVGLIFDGNIESLSGDFIYTDTHARAISVDSRGMLEALRHIYRAERIVEELTSP